MYKEAKGENNEAKEMDAAYFLGNGAFEIRKEAVPQVKPGWVLIRNQYCGVCGTDVHIYHGDAGSADVTPPVILGHEFCGSVVEAGEGVENVKAGDLVTIDPNIYCGECVYCRENKKQLCESMQAVGVTMNGGFAEYSLVPKAQVFRLNKDVPLEAAAMAEPIACCIHGIDLAGIKVGDTVCVVGGGAIGLIMVQLAKLSGAARIFLSEPNAVRRKTALAVGANAAFDPTDVNCTQVYNDLTEGLGADVVIECVGNNRAVESAFAFAKKGATILLFSVPKVDAQYSISLFDVFKKELTIKGSFVNPDTHLRAVKLLNSKKLNFVPIITHKFPVTEVEAAIKMQMSDASIKVLVGNPSLL
ncbi:MAG: zinc-dependent alcohol dehydrogenase family protein [Oscillospiraceae bacterium]